MIWLGIGIAAVGAVAVAWGAWLIIRGGSDGSEPIEYEHEDDDRWL